MCGFDLLNLEYVINYDFFISEIVYVYCVGRMVCVGRVGVVWILLEYFEVRWFWRDFVGEGEGVFMNILCIMLVERVCLDKKEEKGVGEKEEGVKVEDFSEERV